MISSKSNSRRVNVRSSKIDLLCLTVSTKPNIVSSILLRKSSLILEASGSSGISSAFTHFSRFEPLASLSQSLTGTCHGASTGELSARSQYKTLVITPDCASIKMLRGARCNTIRAGVSVYGMGNLFVAARKANVNRESNVSLPQRMTIVLQDSHVCACASG